MKYSRIGVLGLLLMPLTIISVQNSSAVQGSVKVISTSPPTSDGFASHDGQGWFWGAIINFKELVNGTPLKCMEKAESNKGKVLASSTFSGEVQGNSIAPNGVIDTSSIIGPQIRKVVASCYLNY